MAKFLTSIDAKAFGWAALAGFTSALVLDLTVTQATSMTDLFSYVAATPFFMLAAFPLFLVGFSLGFVPCLVACIVALGGILLDMPAAFAFFTFMAAFVPVLGVVALTLMPRPLAVAATPSRIEGRILTALVGYAGLVFVGIYGAIDMRGGDLLGLTVDALTDIVDQAIKMLNDGGRTVTADVAVRMHETVPLLARYTPAFIMSSWLIMNVMAVAVAQSILQAKKKNLRAPFTLAQLHVPNGVIFAAAAAGLVASFAPAPFNYVGLNLALVLGIPFFFAGLAVVHVWAAQTAAPTLVLILFYIIVSIVVHLALLVALLGVVDQWIDFRKRFAERKSSK